MHLFKNLILNGREAIDLIKEAEGEKNLLIGNGFSLSLDKKTFNYQKLADDLYQSSTQDIKLYLDKFGQDEFGNKNIEELVDNLGNIHWWLCKQKELFPSDENIDKVLDKFDEEIEKIKIFLIKSISKKNKNSYRSLPSQASFSQCETFLGIFNKLFTTNYDLLLYFSLFKENQLHKWKDGFTSADSQEFLILNENFSSSNDVNFFYLHGASHLYLNEDNGSIQLRKMKNILSPDSEIDAVMEKTYNNPNNKNKPSIILGGNAEKKKSEIKSISYLKHCFQFFEKIQNNLVTFGFSFCQWQVVA